MHLGTPALLEFFRSHRDDASLVLATVVATEGSTYRKPGAMMLISQDDDFAGLISGGCLEGDLLQHAKQVFADGDARRVTYDMSAGDELVWGLGLGCDGVIHLQLQRLDRADGFGPLAPLERSHAQGRAVLLALAIGVGAGGEHGLWGLVNSADISAGDSLLLNLLRESSKPWPAWRSRVLSSDVAGAVGDVLLIHLPVPPRVLICGAGPDAVPLAIYLSGLDWDVRITDHRPAYARQERFPRSCAVLECRPAALGRKLDLSRVDAAIVMSHQLETDAEYLRQLLPERPAYVGVLGPVARRRRLQEMTGRDDFVLHGPAGLDIGAELPEGIALSIAAEVHAVLNGRDGRPLSGSDRAGE